MAKKKEGKVDVRMRYKKNPDGSIYYGPDGRPVAIGVGGEVKDKNIGKVGAGGDNFFLFVCEKVEDYGEHYKTGRKEIEWNDKTKDWEDTDEDEVSQKAEVVHEEIGHIDGESIEELEKVMNQKMEEMVKKYDLDKSKFVKVGKGTEIPLPKDITSIDSNAYGYIYYQVQGDENTKTVIKPRGKGAANKVPDQKWGTKTRLAILEYIIYSSDAVLTQGSGLVNVLNRVGKEEAEAWS